jgi:hypothetical protein
MSVFKLNQSDFRVQAVENLIYTGILVEFFIKITYDKNKLKVLLLK